MIEIVNTSTLWQHVKQRRNLIFKLKVGPRIMQDPRLIKKTVRSFYKELYKKEKLPILKLLEGLLPRLQQGQADLLEAIPSLEEIKTAVWSCEFSKSPWYDGYNLNFIEKFWHIVGNYFSIFVLDFFTSSTFPMKVNMTWVTLVPKKDFRPISMVSCLYKVMAKLLSRRINQVMEDPVGESISFCER